MPRRICAAERFDPREVGEVVRGGGLVVYPTDTVYGIGCDPRNAAAVRRVFAAKRREKKPMPVLVDSLHSAERLVELGEAGRALAERFWPGALTIVAPLRETLPEELTGGRQKVGVRIPDHPVAISIIAASGGALVGTSANISGRRAAGSVGELDPELLNAVEIVVDAGETPAGRASTVVEVGDPIPEVGTKIAEGVWLIREGPVDVEGIRTALGGRLLQMGTSGRGESFNIIVTTQRGNERNCMRELVTISGEASIRFSRTGFPGLLKGEVPSDPVEFCRALATKLAEDPWRARFIQKVTPIQEVTRAEAQDIRAAVKRLSAAIPEGASFRITVNKRGSEISSAGLIREVAREIERKVDLENPDWIVEIELIRDLAGVSVLRPDDIVSVTKMQEAALGKD
ncbi:MAG: L-threonylcarbamoyladenylate synthase [Candidatus Methanosuratincola sp.]|jgi:L-threonylcarbamoyladenylate synthase|nr:L-threonylcarbamoyladenylate synthase [Candidatus Methanosuratincola sp.]